MCGNHSLDGTPIDHEHAGRVSITNGQITYRPVAGHHDHGHHGHTDAHHHEPQPRLLPTRSRRAFLGDVGKGTLAMAVVTPTLLAACGSSSTDASTAVADGGTNDSAAVDTAAPTDVPADPTAAPTNAPADTAAPTNAPADTAAPTEAGAESAGGPTETLRWARANLGFVSAYVLARGNTAAIVDTGVSGSAESIGEALVTLGLNYSDVAHVVLTHKHGDHAGSIAAVVDQAINATVYAGEADLSGIDQSDIVGVVGGEDVFGFEMLSTPGHTAGHMCVIDHAAGLLVAGDAIFGDGDAVVEGSAQFFEDIPQSRETIKQLAALSYNTVLFGHGEPIESGADAAVAALAASFG